MHNVDVMAVGAMELAAKQATAAISIVFPLAVDPVAAGSSESLFRISCSFKQELQRQHGLSGARAAFDQKEVISAQSAEKNLSSPDTPIPALVELSTASFIIRTQVR